ncbi:FAD-dependent oxidoreductase [Streptomyces hiroshimensis]|uniref:FAD/NAD(P)-binding oxidoreductase n=1 Tax=Streptomyces hiroshimensis TaxID=66424 RepID=A0ABQ2Y7A3_9ACTN|nr:FAD-dependent oxidoreductase [Streptomyces hiroshimensis]GGX64819.1 FAD/NAD(P)-binding oxidoreductase [Streptomyces hiroshimensis]
MNRIVIVGNGPAGHRLAELLRTRDPSCAVTVLGAEAEPAYNRVLLPSVIAGKLSPEQTYLTGHDSGTVTVRRGVSVTGIDRERRTVRTGDGRLHLYDQLVLATGARCFLPPLPGLTGAGGDPAEGVVALRTLADCRRLEERLDRAGGIVVLGGGVLGLEVARALNDRGHGVDVVHMGPHVMERQLDAPAGKTLAGVLERLGIRIHTGRAAASWTGSRLVLDDGTGLPADLVVVSAGVVPNTELARAAGLRVGRGIVVDDHMRTSDPRIHALGDCAEHAGQVSGLIAPAWEQAETLAEALTGGDRPYTTTRTVTRLKARGVDLAVIGDGNHDLPDAEVVTLADPARGQYARLALQDERIVGAILLGFPASVAAVSRLYDAGAPTPVDRLALLAGRAVAGRTDAPADLPGETVVCRCNNVTKTALVTGWRSGARTAEALARATRASTGCGSCAGAVDGICRWLNATREERDEAGDARSGDAGGAFAPAVNPQQPDPQPEPQQLKELLVR